MDAEVRARLVEVADRAVEDYDSGAEPYRSVGEAVIDALRFIEVTEWAGRLIDVETTHSIPRDAPCFRLGVLSLPPQPQAAPKC